MRVFRAQHATKGTQNNLMDLALCAIVTEKVMSAILTLENASIANRTALVMKSFMSEVFDKFIDHPLFNR